jgi:hypothetical protein
MQQQHHQQQKQQQQKKSTKGITSTSGIAVYNNKIKCLAY